VTDVDQMRRTSFIWLLPYFFVVVSEMREMVGDGNCSAKGLM
jgi:hypothetical protein